MLKGLTEDDKYKVIRPIIGEYMEDEYHLPIINKTSISNTDWTKIKPLNFKNMVSGVENKNKLILMFAYDKELSRFWNNPLKYIPQFSTASFISTPDYSVYASMNYNEIRHNVYKNRWLGKTWQNYGCKVIPTIQWCTPETYDICFSGIEKGSSVIISTLGCLENPIDFLNGFNEMKSRIDPEIIIVIGNMIPGMTGTFINYKYTDTFKQNDKYEQLSLIETSPIFKIKETLQWEAEARLSM